MRKQEYGSPQRSNEKTGFSQMNAELQKMVMSALEKLSAREKAAVEIDLGMREPTDEEAKMPADERKLIASRALGKMRKIIAEKK